MERFKQQCASYLKRYIKIQECSTGNLIGWYHYIDKPKHTVVGNVATAQMLQLIKEISLDVDFDCMQMLDTLCRTQNEDGGWSYVSNVEESATLPTAFSVKALILWQDRLNDEQKQQIIRGIDWLIGYKNQENFWGPINKIEDGGYIYYTCVVIQCLFAIVTSQNAWLGSKISEIGDSMRASCDSLLKAFKDQKHCGWGIELSEEPTLFHTAYVVFTLLQIDDNYINEYAVLKAIGYLKDCFIENTNTLSTGKYEYYHVREERRLDCWHSVDIYIAFALLLDVESDNHLGIPQIADRFDEISSYADEANWNYEERVTFWRLYDVMTFRQCYDNIRKKEEVDKAVKRFKIALTFAGKYRSQVEGVANCLAAHFGKEKILYDRFYEGEFARPQLDTHLQKLYHDDSELIVVFLCAEYATQRWCNVEWQAIRDLLNKFAIDQIMYIKIGPGELDDMKIPGIYGSEAGYVDADKRKYADERIAELIIDRYNSMV